MHDFLAMINNPFVFCLNNAKYPVSSILLIFLTVLQRIQVQLLLDNFEGPVT